MAVWVRSSDDEVGRALLFDLHNSRFLMLKSIAAQWNFDPSTILVGSLVLTPDANGNSIRHVDAIRAFSSPKGLGDGLTEQTAFILSGKPPPPVQQPAAVDQPGQFPAAAAAADQPGQPPAAAPDQPAQPPAAPADQPAAAAGQPVQPPGVQHLPAAASDQPAAAAGQPAAAAGQPAAATGQPIRVRHPPAAVSDQPAAAAGQPAAATGQPIQPPGQPQPVQHPPPPAADQPAAVRPIRSRKRTRLEELVKEIEATAKKLMPEETEQSLTEEVAEVAVMPHEEFRRLSHWKRERHLSLYGLLRGEQQAACRSELIESAHAPHHYTTRISTKVSLDSLGNEVATMVGTVHIVPKSTSEIDERKHAATGMVTLARPEGLCLTASDCLLKFTKNPERFRILVVFPRLTGTTSYECKIADTDGCVTHLETVERQDFKVCMASCDGVPGVYVFDGVKTLNVVRCMQFEIWGYPFEVAVLPTQKLDAKAVLGGPVFNHLGELKGVVVDAATVLPKSMSRSAKRFFTTRLGREVNITEHMADVERRRESARVWKGINESLGFEDDKQYENWTNALQFRRLVQIGSATFRTITTDWYDQNPLPKFVDKVVSIVRQRGFVLRSEAPVAPLTYREMTVEEEEELYAQQRKLAEFSHLLPA